MNLSSEHRSRLVITADDFGIRETVDPILRLARLHTLDRVAVMTNYVTTEAAQLLAATGVKIDIHLELIGIFGRGEASGDSNGKRLLHFFRLLLSGKCKRELIRAEWRAQIERFHALFGRYPDGINSHEHVHYFPFFFPIVIELADKYQIPFVRFGSRGVLPIAQGALPGRVVHYLIRINRLICRNSQRTSTLWLVDPNWMKNPDDFGATFPPSGTVELVAHPEHPQEFQRLLDHIPARV